MCGSDLTWLGWWSCRCWSAPWQQLARKAHGLASHERGGGEREVEREGKVIMVKIEETFSPPIPTTSTYLLVLPLREDGLIVIHVYRREMVL